MSVGSHLGIAYPGPGSFMLYPASKDAESPSNLCILYSVFIPGGGSVKIIAHLQASKNFLLLTFW